MVAAGLLLLSVFSLGCAAVILHDYYVDGRPNVMKLGLGLSGIATSGAYVWLALA